MPCRPKHGPKCGPGHIAHRAEILGTAQPKIFRAVSCFESCQMIVPQPVRNWHGQSPSSRCVVEVCVANKGFALVRRGQLCPLVEEQQARTLHCCFFNSEQCSLGNSESSSAPIICRRWADGSIPRLSRRDSREPRNAGGGDRRTSTAASGATDRTWSLGTRSALEFF